jgi:hypothetical protein
MFQIVNGHPDQFGEEQEVEVFRCHGAPSVAFRLAYACARERNGGLAALYIGFRVPEPICPRT